MALKLDHQLNHMKRQYETTRSDIFVNENENENYCAFVHENEDENFLKNENRIRTKINLSERIEINY
jgi:hypothetical protein